ncbi:hypothetical protein [Gilliamella apicola]|uniref:hypothetical protein n=1 Tax=Gilliamella apicola TaxID=1196095 RepID=UPI003986B617
MTEFIELTVESSDLTKLTKLAINTNQILRFFSIEPNNTRAKTKIIIWDGTRSKELYASESYEDILRALEVKQIFGSDDENNARPQKGSTWVL